MKKELIKHRGSCHCGAVKFTVEAADNVVVSECNCSICSKSGYLHLIVEADKFHLLEGEDSLVTYTFNTHTAKHTFCKICGIKPFYIPRSHPDGYSVNFRCLEQDSIGQYQIEQINGKQWETVYPGGRGGYD